MGNPKFTVLITFVQKNDNIFVLIISFTKTVGKLSNVSLLKPFSFIYIEDTFKLKYQSHIT